jgi:hypothetical protein
LQRRPLTALSRPFEVAIEELSQGKQKLKVIIPFRKPLKAKTA